MTCKATLVAPLPEARRISNFLQRDYGEDGAVVSLDERPDGLWSVDAYFESDDRDAIAAMIRDRLGSDAFRAPLAVEELPPTDWVAEGLKTLTPVAVGRFLVHGTHHANAAAGSRVRIAVDAGMAFGTGHHFTTAGCLAVLDRLLARRRYANPIDIGTGSGVLAIALARVLRRPVLATDIDPVSVAVADENVAINHVAHLARIIAADGLQHPEVRQRAPFDLVVANILAEPLKRLAPSIARVTAPGGDIVLSGLLLHQRGPVVAAYRMQGLVLHAAHRFEGWSVLHLRKPGTVRRSRVARRTGFSGRAGGRAWALDL